MKESKKTRVVHCKKEAYDVYVGRPSVWGNPFTHVKDKKTKAEFIVGSREEAVEKYRDWILGKPELLNRLHELKGKTISCWCKPKSCHGDVLAELADSGYATRASDALFGNVCQECGGQTENEYRACKGACSQEMYNGGDLMDTKGLISCNCCEACRWKCHESFMQSVDDGEQ